MNMMPLHRWADDAKYEVCNTRLARTPACSYLHLDATDDCAATPSDAHLTVRLT